LDWKAELKELVRKHALRFGTFTLASGKTASYYLDCRQVTLHPRGANCIAQGMIESMRGEAPDAIGGMAIGADPITASVVTLCGQQGIHIRGKRSDRSGGLPAYFAARYPGFSPWLMPSQMACW